MAALILPNLFPGLRLERDHAVEGGPQVHHIADYQRRRLRSARPGPAATSSSAGSLRDSSGRVEGPGLLEPGYVFRVDLLKRGISHPAGIVTVDRPVGLGLQ